MKIANAKSFITKLMLTGAAAGALMVANPAKAQAEVVVAVRTPMYAQRGAIVVERRPEFLRREAIVRHDEWVRTHRFDHRDAYRYR